MSSMNNQESVLGDYVLQLQKQKEERERKRREQEEAEERKRREEEERQAASARRLRLEEEERLREEKKAKAAKWFLIVLGIIIVVVVVVLLIQKNIEKKQYQIALAEAKAYIASGDSCVAIYHFGEAQEFYDKAKHSKAEQEVRSEIMRKETVLQEAQNKANQEYNDALRRLKIFLDADDGKFNDISSACLDKMIQIYPDRKETKYFQQLRKETGNVNKTNTSKVNTNIGVNTTVHTDSHVSMEDAERIKQEQKNRAATLRAAALRNKIEDLTKKFEENSFLSRERAEHAQVELKKLQQELQNIESSTINSQTSSSVEKKSTEKSHSEIDILDMNNTTPFNIIKWKVDYSSNVYDAWFSEKSGLITDSRGWTSGMSESMGWYALHRFNRKQYTCNYLHSTNSLGRDGYGDNLGVKKAVRDRERNTLPIENGYYVLDLRDWEGYKPLYLPYSPEYLKSKWQRGMIKFEYQ